MAREQFQALFKEVYTAATAVDPASIAAGAELSGTITVTGAALGDFVMIAPGVDLQTLILSATVISANTVEWVLMNETAGAIDLTSSTWNVVVLHPDFSN
jgi:acetyltransferase-like isoleucine patch superfamily enzyme